MINDEASDLARLSDDHGGALKAQDLPWYLHYYHSILHSLVSNKLERADAKGT